MFTAWTSVSWAKSSCYELLNNFVKNLSYTCGDFDWQLSTRLQSPLSSSAHFCNIFGMHRCDGYIFSKYDDNKVTLLKFVNKTVQTLINFI